MNFTSAGSVSMMAKTLVAVMTTVCLPYLSFFWNGDVLLGGQIS